MDILNELERLSKEATHGPWQKSIGLSGVIPTKNYDSAFDCGPKDAELIAAMRNNIDALIAVAKAAKYSIELLEEIEEFAWDNDRAARDECVVLLKGALAELEQGE